MRASDTFGFVIQLFDEYPGFIQDLLEAIHDWGARLGNVVQVLQRPNGFVDLGQIGTATNAKREVEPIKARSRGNSCPANIDILKYADLDVPDLDPNKNIRAAGECDS